MADVQIQQDPGYRRGDSTAWVWAVVVIILVALIAWFLFTREQPIRDETTGIDVRIETPPSPPVIIEPVRPEPVPVPVPVPEPTPPPADQP